VGTVDTVTHTLFGFALYEAVNKDRFDLKTKKAMLLTAIGASQIPDIDVISKWWDHEGMYQMWHRGITHSIFMVPIWAFFFLLLSYWLFKVKDRRIFYIAFIGVFIHSTSDLFNAWGTGYFEPFSSIRITFGTVPIVDVVIWMILLVAFVVKRSGKKPSHIIYLWAWGCIALHFLIQSAHGYWFYQKYNDQYEQVTLSADFIPWHFSVIGKKGEIVEITDVSIFTKPKVKYTLHSKENADLDMLFQKLPEAKTLYEWAPFVVIVDDEKRLGVFDPRFYRNGQSFLFHYIEKGKH
jgi:inner membrane protein